MIEPDPLQIFVIIQKISSYTSTGTTAGAAAAIASGMVCGPIRSSVSGVAANAVGAAARLTTRVIKNGTMLGKRKSGEGEDGSGDMKNDTMLRKRRPGEGGGGGGDGEMGQGEHGEGRYGERRGRGLGREMARWGGEMMERER